MKKITIFIVLANDLGYRGSDIGPVSKKRGEVALQAMLKTKPKWENGRIITSAGMACSKKFPHQKIPFGHMQRKYMMTYAQKRKGISRGHFGNYLLAPEIHNCYCNTRSEIMSALRILQERFSKDTHFDVQIVTSKYHAFRAKLIWNNELKRSGITNRICSCNILAITDRNFLARALEPLKVCVEWMRNLIPTKMQKWHRQQSLFSSF